ncbi:MAG: VCBS repeat-containing protein [Phycisphaerae bacterium]|nr:VCBS repeat-containing protein [Phycisphaerae bacterium]
MLRGIRLLLTNITFALMLAFAPAGSKGTWPIERYDTLNTGATSLPGKITKPEIWWEYYLGPPRVDRAEMGVAIEASLHDLDGDGRKECVEVGGRRIAVIDAAGRTLWSYAVPEASTNAPHCYKVARVLPGSKGLQILAATARMDTGEGYARCFSFEGGVEGGKLVWETANLTGMYGPEAIVADVDADGRMEFCLAPHYRVLILDAVTGKVEHEVKWEVGRNYGLFAAEDVDGDGCRELLVVCDFVLHVDLIDVSPGGVARHAWSKRFIPGAEFDGARQIYIHAGLNALADLDGDGTWEIWLNLFNYAKDGQWHLHILNARDGAVRCDLAGVYVCGGDDLDGDGRIEIVGMACNRQRPNRFAKMVVLRYAGGRVDRVTELDGVRPVLTERVPPDHVASNVQDGYRGLLLSGRRMFAVASTDGRNGDTLVALEFAGDRIVERGRFVAAGADLDVLSLRERGGQARLTVRDAIGAWRVELDGDLKPLGGRQGDSSPGFVGTPIVADLGGACNAVVVPNSAGQIVALRHRAKGGPVELWRAAGRGMTQSAGYSDANRGVVAGDVDGDGRDEIICSHRADSGDGTIRVLRRDGSLVWEHAFERLPIGGLEAGIDLWSVGRFGKRKGLDIWVTLHRSSKISSESVVLSGSDGREMWNVKTATAETGTGGKVSRCFGQAWPFIADVDGDGIDEIGMCPYEIYTVTRGSDGRHVVGPLWLLNKRYFGRWLAYFSPTLVDLDGDGRRDVFLNSASNTAGGVAAVGLDGTPKYVHWHTNPTGCGSFQAVADVDGDGKVEIGAGHVDGRFRCYRGADGSVRWEHALPPGSCSHVIAGDVDGDGRGEFVFVGPDNVLYALNGEADAGDRVAWRLPLGVTGTPVIGDVDGDGGGEVVLVGNDGRLRVIGQARNVGTKD